MNWIALIVLAALLLAAFVFMRQAFKVVVVYDWEIALLYVDGRFVRQLPSGRHRPFALGRAILVQRISPVWMSQNPLTDVLTSDRFSLRLSGMTVAKVVDPRAVVERQAQLVTLAHQAMGEQLVKAAAARTLEQLVNDRAQLGAEIAPAMAERFPEFGELQVAISQMLLPPETRRLLTEVERAKVEGQAALERARGEHAALRSLANAARLMKDNPELMRLRTLQALSPTGKGATLVLGQDALPPLAPAAGR